MYNALDYTYNGQERINKVKIQSRRQGLSSQDEILQQASTSNKDRLDNKWWWRIYSVWLDGRNNIQKYYKRKDTAGNEDGRYQLQQGKHEETLEHDNIKVLIAVPVEITEADMELINEFLDV